MMPELRGYEARVGINWIIFFLGELCMALFGYTLYIQYTCIMYIDLSTEWDSTNGNFRLKKQQIPLLFLVSTIQFSWRPF